jgi:hypothetical protein
VVIDETTNKVTIDTKKLRDPSKFNDKNGNFDEKKFAKFEKRALKDKGIQLLNNLSTAKEEYFYSAGYSMIALSNDGNKGKFEYHSGDILDIAKDHLYPQVNISITPHYQGQDDYKPLPPYSGMVLLAPGEAQRYSNGIGSPLITVPRSGIVYHELNEIYLRTHFSQSYDKAHFNAGGEGTVDFFKVK